MTNPTEKAAKGPAYTTGMESRVPLTSTTRIWKTWALEVPVFSREGAMQTIFLDRDGVINRNRARGDYVKSWEEFQFLPGALGAIARLTQAGFRLLVVTNQACVGKGIVPWATLQEIHARMMQEIARAGGRIDAVLCCPHAAQAGCDCRKPAP